VYVSIYIIKLRSIESLCEIIVISRKQQRLNVGSVSYYFVNTVGTNSDPSFISCIMIMHAWRLRSAQICIVIIIKTVKP